MFILVNILAIFSAVGQIVPAENTGSIKFEQFNLANIQRVLEESGARFEALVVGSGAWVSLLALLLTMLLFFMSLYLQLKAAEGKKPTFNELLSAGLKNFVKLFVLQLLITMIVILGLVFFIIPGLIALTRLFMAPYAMLDKNMGIFDAMGESSRLSKGNAGAIWGVIGVYVVVAGILAGIVSIIPYIGPLIAAGITIVYSVIFALRYYQLKEINKSKA